MVPIINQTTLAFQARVFKTLLFCQCYRSGFLYNVGVNVGAAAGQSVFHAHIHVIPRYEGDVTNPLGGVRNVKKSIVPYDGDGEKEEMA
ncbi:HIT domain-containing protein [Desulfosporosinus hippei DSM 8344]|uniref:HIT domain-containing protein n=1 Tax=Desulfosporosinus hippei DSM 8344 TaxID=1121419 RepID=A0A1G8D3C9_9FIRM|nr:HIT domain-containing protein [Desulfosporosinus hippei DSM 8344]